MAQITITVQDVRGLVTQQIVATSVNLGPIIDSILMNPVDGRVNPGGVVTITVIAHDPEGDALTYAAVADSGSLVRDTVNLNVFRWTAP